VAISQIIGYTGYGPRQPSILSVGNGSSLILIITHFVECRLAYRVCWRYR